MAKEACQSTSNISEICSNTMQTSISFSKNIVIYSTNETVTTTSQIDTLTCTNVSMIKNNNKVTSSNTSEICSNKMSTSTNCSKNIVVYSVNETVTAINNNTKLLNVNNDIEVTQNTDNLNMESLLNNIIISPIPNTSNEIINLDDNNRFENLVILHEVSPQNIVTNDQTSKTISINIVNKRKKIKWYERNRARKGIYGY